MKASRWIMAVALGTCVASAQTSTTYGSVEMREYVASNGRKIRVTSLGNLTGFESPAGYDHIAGLRTRDGYVVAYYDPISARTRVVFDVADRFSSTISAGLRDLTPVSFSGPPNGSTFNIGAPVTATAIVETRDHVLRLVHTFSWTAGLGTVLVQTRVINNLPGLTVGLRTFKAHSDLNVDRKTSNNFNRVANSVAIDDRCAPNGYCPPCDPGKDDCPTDRLVTLNPAAGSVVTIIKAANDDTELTSVGASLATNRTGVRTLEDNQVTLVWAVDTPLAAGTERGFIRSYVQQ